MVWLARNLLSPCLVLIVFNWHILTGDAKPRTLNVGDRGPCEGTDCNHVGGTGEATGDSNLRFEGKMEKQGEDAFVKSAESAVRKAEQVQDKQTAYNENSGLDHHHETKQENINHNQKIGPKDLGDHMHGVLMHGDTKPGLDHHHETKQENINHNQKIGPKDLGDHMHGVLMHGDTEPGLDHHHETKQENINHNQKIGPKDLGDHMHGVLMHGDTKPGLDHHHETKQENINHNQKIGPKDLGDHMHGVLMHGDTKPGLDHHHETKQENINHNQKISNDLAEYMHRVVMHGDNQPGTESMDVVGTKQFRENEDISLNGLADSMNMKKDQLRQEGSDDLSDDDKQQDENTRLMKYRKQILLNSESRILDSDPEGTEIEKRNDGQDNREVEENALKKYVHSLYLSLRNMKRRFFGSAEDRGEREHVEATRPEVYGDMRHELELIGNTAPLNIRHKIYQESRKKRRE